MDDLNKIKSNVTKLLDEFNSKVKEGQVVVKEVSDEIKADVKVVSEKFDVKKFLAGFNLLNPVVLSKWLTSTVRTILILSIVVGIIFAVGYWRGSSHKPISITLENGKEARVKLNGHYLHIISGGNVYIEDKNGKILKTITSADISGLESELRPYGFHLDPILVGGVGYGFDGIEPEWGVGVNWAYAWKLNLDSFLTNKGIYPIGVSYSLKDLKLKNSAVGIAAGFGYDSFTKDTKDSRVIFYWRTKF
jgi:hypothetical protein